MLGTFVKCSKTFLVSAMSKVNMKLGKGRTDNVNIMLCVRVCVCVCACFALGCGQLAGCPYVRILLRVGVLEAVIMSVVNGSLHVIGAQPASLLSLVRPVLTVGAVSDS